MDVQRLFIYSELARARESATITCVWADKKKSFTGKRFWGTCVWRCRWGQLWVCLPDLASYVISGLGCLWLVLCWKQEQKLGKLLVTNQVLASLGTHKLLFSFPDCHQRATGLPANVTHSKLASGVFTGDEELVSWAAQCRLWVKVLFLCMVWPLSVCYSVSHYPFWRKKNKAPNTWARQEFGE